MKSTRHYKLMGLIVLVIMLVLLGLTYFFGIYPGGYTILKETDTEMVVVQKGLTGSEEFVFPVTEYTELKVMMLKLYVSDLKNKWSVIVLFTASLLLSILSSFQTNRLGWRYFAVFLLLVFLSIQLSSYTDLLEYTRTIVAELKSYPSV